MADLAHQLTAAYGKPSEGANRSGIATKQFRIDDEGADDHHAGFCRVWFNIPIDGDTFTLRLENAPHNDDVTALIKAMDGEITKSPIGTTIIVPLHASNAKFVRDLAKAIRRVTARGQRYSDKNWKWVSRRTADTLERFASILIDANKSVRQSAKANAN